MAKFCLTVLMIMFLISCTSPERPKVKSFSEQGPEYNDTALKKSGTTAVKKLGIYTLQGDSIVLPPFEIDVSLSARAKDRIVSSKETIMVDVFLQGTPKNPSIVHLQEDGSYAVGSATREISYGEIAKFDNVRFSRKVYNQLADKDVDITVSVYTGRKTSSNNLIRGDFISDKVSNVSNKRFTLTQKLIDGDE